MQNPQGLVLSLVVHLVFIELQKEDFDKRQGEKLRLPALKISLHY